MKQHPQANKSDVRDQKKAYAPKTYAADIEFDEEVATYEKDKETNIDI